MINSRRDWLKKTALIVAAGGIQPLAYGAAGPGTRRENQMILLNSNENAYGPSPLSQKAILEHYLQSNRYPDDIIASLKKRIAMQWSVNEENILLGAGSSEIIGLSLQLSAKQPKKVLVAEPAYSVWQAQARGLGYEMQKVSLDRERKYDLAAMESAAMKGDCSFVYICNPNNPTGTFVDPAEIKKLAAKLSADALLFVDEAYTEYAELPSLASFALKQPNVIVAKTFSKVYGLAGARVGYAIANADTIKKLAGFQPWPDANISYASAAAAIAALDDQDFVISCKQKTEQAKKMCYGVFEEKQLEYIPSSANFILFNIEKIPQDLVEIMRKKNIMVQHREHFGGRWCRVSMGTITEMQKFLEVIRTL